MSNLFLRRLQHGAALSERDRSALQHLVRNAREVQPGQTLVAQDETAPCLFAVLEGWACHFQLTADGHRQTTDLFLPGDACHLPFKAPVGSEETFAALTRSRIALIDRVELTEVLARLPAVQRAFHWSTLQRMSILRTALTNNGRRLADQRIAHLMCEVRARLASVGLVEPDGFAWPLTQEQVADVCGLTSVHVNRTYRDLRALDLFVVEGRRVRLPAAERLAAFCSFRPAYLQLAQGAASGAGAAPERHLC